MPGQPLDQTISLSGADAVKAQLADLANTGGASLTQLAQSAAGSEAGFNTLGGSIGEFASILAGMRGDIAETTDGFSAFTEILATAAPAIEAFLGAASLGGLFELASSAAEATHQIENLAAISGSSVEEIQGFQFALASVGVSADVGTNAMTKMLAFLGQADQAFQKAADSANALAEAQDVQREKADLSAQSAQVSASNAYQSYVQAADGISKAQVAADKAQLSYYNLQQTVKASTLTGQAYANQQIQLRDAQSNVASATDNIGFAQARANQAAVAASLASQRAAIADKERQATLDKLNESTDTSITKVQQFAASLGIAGAQMSEAGTDGTEAFYKVLDGLNKLSDTEQALYAKQIFSRGWKELIPAIAAGGAALKQADEAWQTYGYNLDNANEKNTELAKSFLVADREFSSFVTAIKNIAGDQITQLFTPALEAMNKFFETNSAGIREFIEGFVQAGLIIENVLGTLVRVAFPPIAFALNVIYVGAEKLAEIWNSLGGDGEQSITGATILWGAALLLVSGRIASLVTLFLRLIGVVGAFTGAMNTLRAGVLAFQLVVASSNASSLALLRTLGLVGALIALLLYDYEHWDEVVAGNTAAVQGFWELLQALWGWFADTWVQVFDVLLQKFQTWIAGIQAYFQSWVDWINQQIKAVADFFSSAWQAAVSFVENLWNGLVDWATGIAQKIQAAFQPVLKFFTDLWAIIQNVTGASADAGTGATGYASGGVVRGPGTGRSDSIPAWVSNGEYVNSAASVARYGVGFFDALNSGSLAISNIGSAVRRMWAGGMVGAPQHFASGGLVAAGAGNLGGQSVVNLHLGGSTYSLIGEKGVVQALTGAARKAAITQTGRSPSWRK